MVTSILGAMSGASPDPCCQVSQIKRLHMVPNTERELAPNYNMSELLRRVKLRVS